MPRPDINARSRSDARVITAPIGTPLLCRRRYAAQGFARLVRFAGVVQRLRGRGLQCAWATLAVEQGYHDQAHLVREVRAFAGLTPEALLAELDPVAFVQYAASP